MAKKDFKVASDLNLYGNNLLEVSEIKEYAKNLTIADNNSNTAINGTTITSAAGTSEIKLAHTAEADSINLKIGTDSNVTIKSDSIREKVGSREILLSKDSLNIKSPITITPSENHSNKLTINESETTLFGSNGLTITSSGETSSVSATTLAGSTVTANAVLTIGQFKISYDTSTDTLVFEGKE